MDDQTLDQIIRGAGMDPYSGAGAAFKSQLRSMYSANAQTQGLAFEQEKKVAYEANERAKEKLENDYRVAKMSAKNAAESNAIDRWKAEKDYELNQERLEIDRGNLEVARGRLDVERGGQGLDLLRTDVDLRSTPRNWAKLSDWESGVAANPFAPAAIQALVNNTSASAGSAAPSQVAHTSLPEQNSLQAVLANLGYGQAASDQTNAVMSGAATGATGTATPATSGGAAKPEESPQQTAIRAIVSKHQFSGTEGYDPKDLAMLKSIAALAAGGEQRYANRFAQLDQDDQDLILGGMARLGRNPDRVARNIDRFRVGQQSARLA